MVSFNVALIHIFIEMFLQMKEGILLEYSSLHVNLYYRIMFVFNLICDYFVLDCIFSTADRSLLEIVHIPEFHEFLFMYLAIMYFKILTNLLM